MCLPPQVKPETKISHFGEDWIREFEERLQQFQENGTQQMPMSQDSRVTPRGLWQEWQTFGTSQRWMHCEAFTEQAELYDGLVFSNVTDNAHEGHISASL